MLVTIEKYDIVKGVTYSRQFELNSDCLVLENNGLTLNVFHGDFKELCILCRDKDRVDFVSARIIEDLLKDIVCYHFDTIKYFYDNEFKVLVRSNDIF